MSSIPLAILQLFRLGSLVLLLSFIVPE